MSDNNFDEKGTQYTEAPNNEPVYNQTPGNSTYETVNYSSGKGQGMGFGIASMIVGIVSLIGCCGFWYIGVPCAIVAIVLGIVQIMKNESKGMAIAGIACGGVGLVLSILVVVGAFAILNSLGPEYQDLLNQYGY